MANAAKSIKMRTEMLLWDAKIGKSLLMLVCNLSGWRAKKPVEVG